MSTKAMVPTALLLAVLGGVAVAAEPSAGAPVNAPGAPAIVPPAAPAPDSPVPAVTGGPNGLPRGSYVDPWVAYTRPDCCGPVGADGPIVMELYYRFGASLPVNGGYVYHGIQAGGMTSGGGRTLLFNAANDAAWTADVGLSYTYNNGNKPENTTTFNGSTVDIRGYNRTSFDLGLGREWYWNAPGSEPMGNFRYGFDTGGRWGTSHLDLNVHNATGDVTYTRKQDVYGAYFIALHADVLVPLGGCWTLIGGVRAEYTYNWVDILPGAQRDLEDVNLMLTMGLRF
jgi:hypothetical protein